MTPITRLEIFLNGIINGGEVPEPITRTEIMLNDIKNGDVVTLTPITRGECYLARISGADVQIPEPVTRVEMYLAKKCGVDINTPSPIVRIEHWLNAWASGEDPLVTLTGKIISFFSRAAKPFKSTQVAIEPVQSGTGDPSPDNVRPISGHTGAEIYDNGVNQWDEETEPGSLSTTTGEEIASVGVIRSKNFCPCLPNTTYYGKSKDGLAFAGIRFYDRDKNFVGNIPNADTNNKAFTTPANAYFFRLGFIGAYGTTYKNDISINYPSTDHDYHAYSGTSVSLTFGSTVYGCQLTDNGDGTWTGVATHKMVDLGTLTWTLRNNNNNRQAWNTIIDDIRASTSGNDFPDWYCSEFAISYYNAPTWNPFVISYGGAVGSKTVTACVNPSQYVDAAAFKAAMSGVQFVYELDEPITFTVSGDTLSSLVGVNNAWADTGNITAEVYGTPVT